MIVPGWAAEQPNRLAPPRDRDDRDSRDSPAGPGASPVGVAVDGKTLRGARQADGTQVQLLAALRHDTGAIVGQRNVDNDKTNEILALALLLGPLTIAGMVVTADAMHTQRKAAELVVGTKAAHYILGVKKNQPALWNAGIDAHDAIDVDRPKHDTTHRGHSRIDRHRVWTAPVPATVEFPYAQRFIIVERESSTLDDVRTSIETRIYVTDLTDDQASAGHLLRLVRGH